MNYIIYIATPDSQQIHIWEMNHQESLKLIQILHTPGSVQPMVIHPNKKILYAGIRPNPRIISYHIHSDGSLSENKTISTFGNPTYLSINSSGEALYSASYQNNCLNIIALNKTGDFKSIAQIIYKLPGCHSANLNNNNQKIFIPCLKENSVHIYNLDSTGQLYSNSVQKIHTAINSGPRHMALHNLCNYAYLINELNNTINVIKINSSIYDNYIPRIIQTINIVPKIYNDLNKIDKIQYWGSDIHITSNNRWIYCTDRNTNIISSFMILNNKQLRFLDYQLTEKQPRGFAIDNNGKYLIVAGQKSNAFTIYKINDNNGKLTQFFRSSTGLAPMWISILNQ